MSLCRMVIFSAMFLSGFVASTMLPTPIMLPMRWRNLLFQVERAFVCLTMTRWSRFFVAWLSVLTADSLSFPLDVWKTLTVNPSTLFTFLHETDSLGLFLIIVFSNYYYYYLVVNAYRVKNYECSQRPMVATQWLG